ncbi:hypothetical protein ABZ532_10445 [Streptomyces sp. NPDC019396]|uniref:hypothetical protein n=1 Tax=Streptomyces sp. NPDC019396 TaxID=3154687 RepID=UPI0033DE8220
MGIYLYDLGAECWSGDQEGGWAEVASALNHELARRGLPRYEPAPGQGPAFEEKLARPMAGFSALCDEHLSPRESQAVGSWTVLVPLSLDTGIVLPIANDMDDETVIVGAPQILGCMERLAAVLALPPEIPTPGTTLALTAWRMDGSAETLAAARPGPWSEDLDTAFYVAVYRQAARHALSHGCPMTYS